MPAKPARNVPVVMQMEATECGAACLVMILAHYGRWVPLEEARVKCGVSRDGSKAVNIMKAACSYGMQADSRECSMQELLESESLPCIASWNRKNFVVLCGFSGGKALLNDPGRGSIKVDLEAFERSYGGTVLEFKPTDAFEKGGERPSTIKFALERLQGQCQGADSISPPVADAFPGMPSQEAINGNLPGHFALRCSFLHLTGEVQIHAACTAYRQLVPILRVTIDEEGGIL